jgi:hypothetical protein
LLESFQAISTIGDSHVTKHENPNVPSFQRPLEYIQAQFPRSPYLSPTESFLGQYDVLFFEVKWPRRVWNTRKNDKPKKSYGNGEDSIDDEQPSPSRHASYTREIRISSSLEIATDHATQWVADEPCSRSFEKLVTGIPRSLEISINMFLFSFWSPFTVPSIK